jgi:hypothetical protein
MRRYDTISGILLILSIIDFAVAAPVLVQEKCQPGVDAVYIPEDAITMLGKRGDELVKFFLAHEDHFAKPEVSSAARPSTSFPPSGSNRAQMGVKQPPPPSPKLDSPPAPPGPASSTMSDADYELVGAHDAPLKPGPSTESYHDLTGMHAPQLSPVLPTWFLTDHGYSGPHASQPNPGRLVAEEPPSRPASPIQFDAGHEYELVRPPSPSPGSAPATESDYEMVGVPPPGAVSSTNRGRRSMGADSRLENLRVHAVRDALKGNAKESRLISGTARDVLKAAQRELQRERSLDPGE